MSAGAEKDAGAGGQQAAEGGGVAAAEAGHSGGGMPGGGEIGGGTPGAGEPGGTTAVGKPGVGAPGAPGAPGVADPAADPAAAARRAGRRELTITVLIALLGGVIAWACAGRTWATGLAGSAPNTLKVTASGNDLSAGVTALGLTALAGALALFATQRLARRLVGVLLIAAGIGTAVYAFGERGTSHAARVLAQKAAAKGYATDSVHAHSSSWWLLAVIGGVLVVLAGASAVLRGGGWPGMSSRYENAASKAAARAADTGSAKDLWDALDRGEDPTEPAEAPAVALNTTPGAEH
ncbi:Trp biosynthesis-associated membrane protein [Catenulispora sp. NL8]|uniref:Trp biosynthesis-associated membrane protein n=1 Tax=Catenulispora pinistramenti TaxID=2705254 RepID=A0ABS5KSY9_9ACTN|nr:Trp biosynthesis-associated membrane protein [Catenulispora pinistramenti]MBS2549168.1 Trp biosynthesis-associated membrane protein [Catenulispora pinistramenti]